MLLKVVSSGSKGNAYILDNDNEVLLIEGGLPFREIKIYQNFKVSNIVGMIVSHEHG